MWCFSQSDRVVIAHPNEVSGQEALRMRDKLETAVLKKVPKCLQPFASRRITWATALAPSSMAAYTLPKSEASRASLRRWMWSEVGKLSVELCVGFTGLLLMPGIFKIFAAPLFWSPMRGIVSGVGHVISHHAKGKSASDKTLRFLYDFITAMLVLSPLRVYDDKHKIHHAHTAEKNDPDVQLLEYLQVDFRSGMGFLKTALSPRLHFRFWTARVEACLFDGPLWRRIISAATPFLLMHFLPLYLVCMFYMVVGPGYHATALGGFCTLHHFFALRSPSTNMKDSAVEVTLGRLNLAPATLLGFGQLLCGILARAVLYPWDPHHDLHHGAWPNSLGPHTAILRTQLILGGVSLRQAVTVTGAFRGAFEANKRGLAFSSKKKSRPIRMDSGQVSQL